jgi:fluoride exporter
MLGGAIGAGMRYGVYLLLANIATRFPWPTLLVNVIGSVLIGYLAQKFGRGDWSMHPQLSLLLMTGILGGFTTFSAFSLDTVKLIQAGQGGLAILNIALSVGLCIGGCAAGVWLARFSPVSM